MIYRIPKLDIWGKRIDRNFFLFLWLLCLISLSSVFCSFGQSANENLESQVKAAYIYNFTKFLEWKTKDFGFFTIVVLGKSSIANSLYKIASSKKINGKTIIVNEISDLSNLDFCNILYLVSNDDDILIDTLKKIKGKNVLLITSAKGFAEKGAAINFVQVGDKIKFEINRKELEEKGIIPNSSLLSLAYKIYE
jgi:hypothetical protein